MIIYRAFIRESLRNTLALALALTVIMVFTGLSLWLGRAVRGDIGQSVVMSLLGLETLRRLDILLTLSFYLGVLFTLARWYRDNEMAVLAACGVSLTQLLRPALVLTLFVALTVAVLGGVVNPWAATAMDELKVVGQRQTKLADTAPGVFNEAPGSGRVYYAEHVDDATGQSKGIFVAGSREGRTTVSAARRASPWTDPETGDRYLLLEDGTSYEGSPGDADYRLTRFDKLYLWIKPPTPFVPSPRIETADIPTLLSRTTREASAELHWRLSKPVVVAVLVFFAMVMAYTDPRRGRMASFFSAVLVYFIYTNLLAYGETLLKRGRMPAFVGLWWVHGLMLAVSAYFFWRRQNNRPLLPWGR
jgi:lipopolysaccharide export system permease protein